ncbi:MAG: biopolymer transporter ExbD [Candidatus Aminicenantes bacterium]|nr:biopolymer transporter ExbD [Candidatus Aminicenantes bacterium]MCK5222239.1 biopolymer transporter ExbD [Candidatus Aminicenantes bacterium]
MSAELGAGAKSEPNVVPLCDILLVLLIIFMVITPVAQKGIDIKLPETASEPGGPTNITSLVLVIESDLTITINREPISKEMLETRLRDLYQTDSKKPLFVKADETVSYKEVLSIIDIAKGAGVEVVGVYTDRYQTGQ